jgi:hypothetical protein
MKDSPWQDAKPTTSKSCGVEMGIIVKFFNDVSFCPDLQVFDETIKNDYPAMWVERNSLLNSVFERRGGLILENIKEWKYARKVYSKFKEKWDRSGQNTEGVGCFSKGDVVVELTHYFSTYY